VRLVPARPIFSPERSDTVSHRRVQARTAIVSVPSLRVKPTGAIGAAVAIRVLHRFSTCRLAHASRPVRSQKPCGGKWLWRRRRVIAAVRIHSRNEAVDAERGVRLRSSLRRLSRGGPSTLTSNAACAFCHDRT
jgi:hypothetical protein